MLSFILIKLMATYFEDLFSGLENMRPTTLKSLWSQSLTVDRDGHYLWILNKISINY